MFGHPTGLFGLFFAEMWERFSYYGMRALLVFYMIKGFLSYTDGEAYAVYGAYTALVYATPFIGGMLADRLLGARRAVILGGSLMYFLADEWATRGPAAARGGYWLTKVLFLVSLLLAVALNLDELFFLIIIVPAILVLFLIYGLLSGWVYNSTRHPAVGAVANAIAFASAVAVTFPVVSG
jgi:hypothetical protein